MFAAAAGSPNLMLQATIFLGAALLFVPLGKRFGIATVLGYLITGLILGPSGLDVAGDAESLLHFSEFGVVMLLFIIGLELQPSRLWALRRSIFVLGGLQVGLTGTLLMGLLHHFFALQLDTAFIVGFGLALSSTAFVLQILTEKQQLSSTHGREAFTILLFQDIAVIPLLAVIPFLSGVREQSYDLLYFGKVFAVFAGLIFASRYVVRPFFKFVASSGASELLTAVALFIVMGVSILMGQIGLSMALGAFLTGVLLADSEYRHELEASIEPFKGLLLGLFFMSVGMLTDVKLILAKPIFIIGCALALMFIKFAVIAAIAKVSGNRWPTSIRLGVTLAQGGEFAFVLFSVATAQSVLRPDLANTLNLVVTISMALTPLAFLLLEKIGEPLFAKRKPSREYDTIPDHEHQVIIAGFGRVGQIIGRVLRMHNIEFTAIERSANRVDFVRKFGNQVYYGDPKNPEILRAAGIQKARVFILAIDDLERSITTAQYLRKNYPELIVLARARDRQHYYRLREVGVRHIWRETYLSSLDMSRESLQLLGISPEKARETVKTFRDYDDDLIERQQAIYDDEASMIESAQSAMAELESLFDEDIGKARKMDLTDFYEALKSQATPVDEPHDTATDSKH
ncbi:MULTISPECIES: monovalent cation:proton antiporter-2 (CPA2) family protein [Psychrobacter]|uniref:monovalent cation:proton antiporter-2 (CPA2) family protein n=1 Tax=Psychrobacter TaxID=497 RepID=UPI0008A70F16|nr:MULTISPECIES: monovalent cation:proton antiporter-2 (CPA2) family protein [Psychrobacter]AOY44757.1 glutathione-regulated potassium-efflux system protein KefC [Psychrobacter sp. AntiMn-1]MED6316865.1 monovalent cation:proton antiporter-2 (CPA2) family protein [Pseudomonadota bacterium]|tara:strand:+ start:1335 stop:3221 length:1887 start_codon:yes stop_codon:yes gene_type:complete